jgi:hypothetical protein
VTAADLYACVTGDGGTAPFESMWQSECITLKLAGPNDKTLTRPALSSAFEICARLCARVRVSVHVLCLASPSDRTFCTRSKQAWMDVSGVANSGSPSSFLKDT